MTDDSRASLAVENGLVLHGHAVGAAGESSGDLVFNTAMSGYHEILTDPSYAGQVVVMTYPLIGNYGVAEEDAESRAAWPEAFVMREMSSRHSSHRADKGLREWLVENGVVAIEGVDTRRLTKTIRTGGTLRCVVSTIDHDPESLLTKAREALATDGRDLASTVSCKEPYAWTESYDASYPASMQAENGRVVPIVAFDLGIKRNILRSMVHCGFEVTTVPAWTPADEVLAMDPEGIFLSNGPGDPAAVTRTIDAVADLVGKKPIFGICLGHQILSIVLGAKTHKMPFGHHGANHPVRDVTTGRVEITSQNHSFSVDPDSLPDDLELTHINLNDHTVEGTRHRSLPISQHPHTFASEGRLDHA